MQLSSHDPSTVPAAVGGYTNALQVDGGRRWLFISGQVPQGSDGVVPDEPEAQCRQVWANVLALLSEAEMSVQNLVKVTTYLSDRAYAEVNSRVRAEILGAHRPALTVILAGIWDSRWLLEIEAVAVA